MFTCPFTLLCSARCVRTCAYQSEMVTISSSGWFPTMWSMNFKPTVGLKRKEGKKKNVNVYSSRTSASVNNHLLDKVKALICALILQFVPLMKPRYFFTPLGDGVEPEYSRNRCKFSCTDPDSAAWTRKATFEQQGNGNGATLFSKFSKSEFSVLDESVGLFSSKFRFDALTVWRA